LVGQLNFWPVLGGLGPRQNLSGLHILSILVFVLLLILILTLAFVFLFVLKPHMFECL